MLRPAIGVPTESHRSRPRAPALQFTSVSKRFGTTLALDGLSFHIPEGSIAGLVGHNGAGKTTAFSVVSGFLLPDQGEVDILGQGPYRPEALKGHLGVLPQDAELPDRHTAHQLLVHLGCLQGMQRRRATAEATRVLEVVGLSDRAHRRIATLSHGMRRRVAVASALCGSPRLVLLDEPLAGLDPVQAHSLRDALADLRGIQTLVVSSHNLAELERLCDWVVMIKDGRRLRQGSLAEVTGRGDLVRWDLVEEPVALDLAALRASLQGHTLTLDGAVLTQQAPVLADMDGSSLVIMRALVDAGVALRGVTRGMGLEQRFIADSRPPAPGDLAADDAT